MQDLRILGLIGNSLEGYFGVVLDLEDAAPAFAVGTEGIIDTEMQSLLWAGIDSWLEPAESLVLERERLDLEEFVEAVEASNAFGLEERARSDEDLRAEDALAEVARKLDLGPLVALVFLAVLGSLVALVFLAALELLAVAVAEEQLDLDFAVGLVAVVQVAVHKHCWVFLAR